MHPIRTKANKIVNEIVDSMVSAVLRKILETYSDLDSLMPPLCFPMNDRELAGAIYEHCDVLTVTSKPVFLEAIEEVWDEAEEEVDCDTSDCKEKIIDRILGLTSFMF